MGTAEIRATNQPMPEYGLRTGDYIAVVPVDRFRCDSVYVLDVLGGAIACICQSSFRVGIDVKGFGEGATTATYTPEQFEDLLLGQVAATCKVIDPTLLDERFA